MHEFLPVAFGMLIGVGAMQHSTRRWRFATVLLLCVIAGIAASAINGELAQRGWLVFVSADSLLVWLGAAAATATVAAVRKMRVA